MYFSQTGVALRGAPIHNVLAEPCGLSHIQNNRNGTTKYKVEVR